MAKSGLTRRQVLVGAAPIVAALPMAGLATVPSLGGASAAAAPEPAHAGHGHAAMFGAGGPGARAARTTWTPC